MTATAVHTLGKTLPSGPQSPPLWQIIQWLGRPLEFMESCAHRYGDLFTLDFGRPDPIVFCSHPKAIETLFTAAPECFETGAANQIMLPLLGESSLVLLDGDRHQRMRQLLMPPFHGDRMRTYGDLIVQVTEKIANTWTIGQPFLIRPSIQNISIQVIMKAVFGVSDPQRSQALQRLMPEFLELTGSPFSSSLLFLRGLQRDLGAWSPWGRFVRLRSQLDQLIYQEIAQRRAEKDPSRTDILALLLAARDEAGAPLTDGELRDELMTLLFAGHETTASAITWALYWIHYLPEVYDRLMAELQTCPDLQDPKVLMRLPYLNAVCQETLRIYPVAPISFPRRTLRPVQVMNHEIPAGTVLMSCIYLTHRRPELYPHPDEFRPWRFLERQFSAYEYIPFGGGDRRCIGMAFAQFEMKLVLAALLSRFRLRLTNSQPLKPKRRGITLAPPADLKFLLEGVPFK